VHLRRYVSFAGGPSISPAQKRLSDVQVPRAVPAGFAGRRPDESSKEVGVDRFGSANRRYFAPPAGARGSVRCHPVRSHPPLSVAISEARKLRTPQPNRKKTSILGGRARFRAPLRRSGDCGRLEIAVLLTPDRDYVRSLDVVPKRLQAHRWTGWSERVSQALAPRTPTSSGQPVSVGRQSPTSEGHSPQHGPADTRSSTFARSRWRHRKRGDHPAEATGIMASKYACSASVYRIDAASLARLPGRTRFVGKVC